MLPLVFAAVALAQLGTPVFMIAQREKVLRRGEEFRFRAAPVDPYDAFRGRFVRVNVASNRIAAADAAAYARGERIHVTVTNDADGWAHFAAASRRRPEGHAWIRTRVEWVDGRHVAFDTTMHRFYMEETEAPAAETAVRDITRRDATNRTAAIVARIRDGLAVMTDLEIDGRPVREVLREARSAAPAP
jgi:predicted thioesterase